MDWAINGCVLFLVVMGMMAVASASPHELFQHTVALIIGAVLMCVCAMIDWRPIAARRSLIFTIYSVGVALLVVTYFFAPMIRGTRSWLVFGPLQFQTSEFMKIGLIILYSYYFARRHAMIGELRNIVISLLYAAVPIGLIALQPDMGSALIIAGLWIAYLFVSGIKWRHIAVGIFACALLMVFGWSHLAEYQRDRIYGLFNPRYDPLGVNYNVIQSKIAIGSSGFVGKGWKQGPQVQLGFLPEAANDFIFSAIAEEWGLVGMSAVLGVFLILMVRLVAVGARATGNFSKLVCLGTAALFMVHIAFNIGSAVGFMPVIGVPLPLVSYGGSSILTFCIALGIVQSIAIRSAF